VGVVGDQKLESGKMESAELEIGLKDLSNCSTIDMLTSSRCNTQRGTVHAVAQLASQSEPYEDIFKSSNLMHLLMRTLT